MISVHMLLYLLLGIEPISRAMWAMLKTTHIYSMLLSLMLHKMVFPGVRNTARIELARVLGVVRIRMD
jgi:hypothetical protein